jgi:hypothetical protein
VYNIFCKFRFRSSMRINRRKMHWAI